MDFLPLRGVRVIDVTTSLAGPYCTEVLAALGADVIKVEPPSGDEARTWGPPFVTGESALFLAMNAGKRSLALDLRKGTDVLLRLVDSADVFVQSLRPGLAAELGLDAESLRRRNPRLVHCSITGFGRTGPWAVRPGYDPLAQAAGGILSVTGEPERPGVRVGVSLVDQGTGLWAALGVLAALMERERTGEGRSLDVSLYETAVAYMGYHVTGYLGSGAVPGRTGTGFPSIAPYQVFRASDGELMVAAGNDRLFAALCHALDVPELPEDERFTTNPSRVEHRDELVQLLSAPFLHEGHSHLARGAGGSRRPGGPRAGCGAGGRGRADGGPRHPPAARERGSDRGSAAVGRRCTRYPSAAATRARRGYVGGLAGSRLLRGGDRRPGPRRSR